MSCEMKTPLLINELSTVDFDPDSHSEDRVAIRVENVSKCYHIYERPQHRLKQSIYPRLQRLLQRTPRNYFREFWALRNVSFQVEKGETVGIIGRNGSGKSTLLQVICGTLAPTAGSVEVNGRIAALLELGAGFNPEFTGRENVYMNGAILGLNKEEIDTRFEDIAGFADIGDFIDQPVKTYSSGMYMRLAFAVMANVDADILVIDEALAVGDAFFTQKCMKFLRKFPERGTLLFVSHDSAAVVNLCQRAIWLHNGNLRMHSGAKEVCESYHAALVEDHQGPSVAAGVAQAQTRTAQVLRIRGMRDQRQDIINASSYRNDIQVFGFNPDSAAFGIGGSRIVGVSVMSQEGSELSWVVGGELVLVVIVVEALRDIFAPIVGFIVKDRLGQALFSDNTFLSYAKQPIWIGSGQTFEARFTFRMPILPAGDYVIAVSVAEGTQAENVQHHWLHDALVLKSHSSSVCTGLVGIPMLDIQLTTTAYVGKVEI